MTTTQPYEIRVFLGGDWTEQQIEQITDEYQSAEATLDEPTPEQQQALLSAVAQRVDGTLDRIATVEDDAAAQIKTNETRLALRSALVAEVIAGMSESEASRLYGITRMTVRSWLGKG